VDQSFFVAEPWFNERAHDEWHMNNYIIVPGFIAFVFFAFMPWFIGGVCAALTLPAFSKMSWKRRRWLVIPFAISLVFCGLGFNTFDFMLGCFYWTNGCEPAPVIINLLITNLEVNAWNYYFFIYLVPLLVSGFCFGLTAVFLWLKLKLK